MSVNENKLRKVVIEALRIGPDKYKPDLRLGDIEEWDSVAHLDLITSIEGAFNLKLSATEIVELTSLEDLRARISRA